MVWYMKELRGVKKKCLCERNVEQEDLEDTGTMLNEALKRKKYLEDTYT